MSLVLCALTTGSERWQGRLHGRPSERREGEEGREGEGGGRKEGRGRGREREREGEGISLTLHPPLLRSDSHFPAGEQISAAW